MCGAATCSHKFYFWLSVENYFSLEITQRTFVFIHHSGLVPKSARQGEKDSEEAVEGWREAEGHRIAGRVRKRKQNVGEDKR